MLENHYVYKKVVDWSLLNQGMSIPLDIQVVLQNSITNFIARGESKEIYFVLDGKTYTAKLTNQKFDDARYLGHKDILQIRYNPQSEIAVKLRSIYFRSYEFILEQRNYRIGNTRTYVKLPDEKKEFLAVYTKTNLRITNSITFAWNAA